MADSIPDELIIEILARLPVVSLLRFTSVCKSWCSLITSPSFITKHLNHTKRTSTDKLVLRLFSNVDKRVHYLLCRDDENFGDDCSELELPSPHCWVVGNCNGLICLCDSSDHDWYHMFVWNPSIRKLVALPRIKNPQGPYSLVIGFGAHPTTHEYKVICIVHRIVLPNKKRAPAKVELYTQGTGSWREICSASPPCFLVKFDCLQTFLNGAVHWIARDPFGGSGTFNSIVSFDMGAEAFSEMMVPPTLADQYPLRASVFRESLAVLCFGQMDTDSCCLWVMKEYGVTGSWTKLFSIQLPEMMGGIPGLRKNGEVLLSTRDNSVVSYDPGTKTMTDSGIRGKYLLHVDTYIETLVLVVEGNCIFEGQLDPL